MFTNSISGPEISGFRPARLKKAISGVSVCPVLELRVTLIKQFDVDVTGISDAGGDITSWCVKTTGHQALRNS